MKYRDELPLDERDFATIRANVRERIAEKPRLRWRFAVAFAAAVLFVVLTWPRAPQPVATVSRRPTLQVPRYARHDSAVVTVARKPHHRKHHHRPKAVLAAAQPTVIQLQTSNPDVRIIWIGGHS